jgi:hypothetical protein
VGRLLHAVPDVDDRLHRDLPVYVLANERESYFMNAGYTLDALSGIAAWAEATRFAAAIRRLPSR